MPIDVTTFAVALADGRNRHQNLAQGDLTQGAVLAGLMSNSVTGLFVGRLVLDRKAEEQPRLQPAPPTGSTGNQPPTGGSGGPGGSTSQPTLEGVQATADEAKNTAAAAAAVAVEARGAVDALASQVETGFQQVNSRLDALSPPAPGGPPPSDAYPSPAAPARPRGGSGKA